MKNVLIAFSHNGRRSFGMYPHMLRQADIDVTIIANSKFKPFVGKGYVRWVDASCEPDQFIHEVATECSSRHYDWVILGDDDVLRALSQSKLPDAVKARIGPVAMTQHISLFGNKFNTSETLSKLGICVSPARLCNTVDDINAAAHELGLPVIIKPNQGLGSEGVAICRTDDELKRYVHQFIKGAYVVEKYICGKHIRVEPLFFSGQLIAANASLMHHTVRGELGLATERLVISASPFTDMLRKLGEGLQFTGFISIGGIRETTTGDFYLFEVDCRPTEWPCLGDVFEVDIAQTIRNYVSNPNCPTLPHLSPDNGQIAKSFMRDIPYLMRKRNIKGLLGWLTNKDGCWRCLPLHDLRLFAYWIWVVMGECVTSIAQKIAKMLGIKKPARG